MGQVECDLIGCSGHSGKFRYCEECTDPCMLWYSVEELQEDEETENAK